MKRFWLLLLSLVIMVLCLLCLSWFLDHRPVLLHVYSRNCPLLKKARDASITTKTFFSPTPKSRPVPFALMQPRLKFALTPPKNSGTHPKK